MIQQTIYRLTLDENGVEDSRDYSLRAYAEDDFAKAKRRKGVFSARIRKFDFIGDAGATVLFWERDV